jgi:hypothetical protein
MHRPKGRPLHKERRVAHPFQNQNRKGRPPKRFLRIRCATRDGMIFLHYGRSLVLPTPIVVRAGGIFLARQTAHPDALETRESTPSIFRKRPEYRGRKVALRCQYFMDGCQPQSARVLHTGHLNGDQPLSRTKENTGLRAHSLQQLLHEEAL